MMIREFFFLKIMIRKLFRDDSRVFLMMIFEGHPSFA